jgi:hypothetical protein
VISGHLGVAGAAGAARRDVPVLVFAGAAVAPDVLDAAYAAVHFCNPWGLYSHTLPIAGLLAASIAGGVWLVYRSPVAATVAALVVLLHLPADLLTGHKLLWPGGELIGLDLYRRPLLDFLVEAPIAFAGWLLYRRRGAGERWARGHVGVVLVLLLQGAIDLYSVYHPKGIKPSGCAEVTLAG